MPLLLTSRLNVLLAQSTPLQRFTITGRRMENLGARRRSAVLWFILSPKKNCTSLGAGQCDLPALMARRPRPPLPILPLKPEPRPAAQDASPPSHWPPPCFLRR